MASSSIIALKASCRTSEGDECYTPCKAVKPLLKFLDKNLLYYDCTSGISKNIVNCLLENGFKAKDSGSLDYLKDKIPDDFDVLITNPPYSKKDAFLEKAYLDGRPFAMLLPVTALQGIKRNALFKKYGVEILVLNKRVDFTGKGSPHFGVAWFCRGLLPCNLMFEEVK